MLPVATSHLDSGTSGEDGSREASIHSMADGDGMPTAVTSELLPPQEEAIEYAHTNSDDHESQGE